MRQMAWSSIIGQEHLKRFLQRTLLHGRLRSAYCLWGPEGVGKDALALEFAKLLQCDSPRRTADSIEACDECSHCRMAARLEHPNIRLIFALPAPARRTDGASPLLGLSDEQIAALREELRRKAENPYHNIMLPNALQIHIAAIRDLQQTLARSVPLHGRPWVIILSEADRMTLEAANTLLKTLEEPPGRTLILLTTSRREQLPATILSRCQQLYCPPIPDELLFQVLQERHKLSPEHARMVTAFAHGSYSRALEFLQSELPELRTQALQLLRTALKPGHFRRELLHQLEELGAYERNRAELLLQLLLLWLRDALLLRHAPDSTDLYNPDQRDTLQRFLERFPHADLAAMLEAVDSALQGVRQYLQLPLLFAVTFLRCRAAAGLSVPTELTHGVSASL